MNDELPPAPPMGPVDPLAAQIAGYFQIDPVWQGVLTRPAAETRAAIRAALTSQAQPQPVEHVADYRIPVAGGDIGLRLYRPVPEPAAVIVWAHGGGFAFGSVDEVDSFARVLARASNCAVASVDYRLAPEHRFPTALHDVRDAVLWVAQHVSELAGGAVPLILGGDSAGANLATIATRKLHEAGKCNLAANILAYPSTQDADAQSLRQFTPPFLSIAEISWFFDQYLPAGTDRNTPDFAPMLAENLHIMPPTLIITAEHDIITAQAEAYGRKLRAAGVAVRYSRHPGMIHGFLTLEPFFPGAAGAAIGDIADFIETHKAERPVL